MTAGRSRGAARIVPAAATALIALLAAFAPAGAEIPKEEAVFSFEVAADMREFAGPKYQSSQYFLGACEAIRDAGKGAFMVSPGDIDPPGHVADTIEKILGKDYTWYPVAGNHEVETKTDMLWLRKWAGRGIPRLTRAGPDNCKEMTYSFDFENAHFVVINQYCDGAKDDNPDGNIRDPLYRWLEEDLAANSRPHIFVFGHEPLISIPDADNGRHRRATGNLEMHPENSHRFQALLRKHGVTAYINGHTHDFSFARINGLWQLDAGHARGVGDKGVQSTFLKVWVGERSCWVDVYRDDADGGKYSLTRTIVLK